MKRQTEKGTDLFRLKELQLISNYTQNIIFYIISVVPINKSQGPGTG